MKNYPTVIEIYKGVPIKNSQVVSVRVDAEKYKELIDVSEKTGLSVAEIIIASSRPCSYCKGIEVVTMNRKDEYVQVKRGILSAPYKKQTSGAIITNQKRRKNVEEQPTGITQDTSQGS